MKKKRYTNPTRMSHFIFVYSFVADCIIFLICLLNIDDFIIQQVYDGCCKTWNDLYLCERIIYLPKIALYESQFNLNILLVSVSFIFFSSGFYFDCLSLASIRNEYFVHEIFIVLFFIQFRIRCSLFRKNCVLFGIHCFVLLEKHEKH